jgi:serine/threonine-protein kinase
VLFTIVPLAGGIENAQIAVLDLESRSHKVIVRGGGDAHYLSSGHLVYGVAGTLQAVAFDLNRLETIGAPVAVVPQIQMTNQGGAVFDVAQDGTLVYVAEGTPTAARTLVWVDRQGREEGVPASPREYLYPRLSPDGKRIAVTVVDQEVSIWLWDRRLTRLTAGPGSDSYHAWMPDGHRVLFSSERAGARNLFLQSADGPGKAERLTESPNLQSVVSVSPDGTRAVFHELRRSYDLMLLRLDQNRRVEALLQAPFNEWNGEISPDGHWLAFEADESGRSGIYVRPFPDVNSGRWEVSAGGGTRPLWARDGRELFYLSDDGALMSVPIEQGDTWRAGAPTKVLETRYLGTNSGGLGRTYDVSPDGRRFLMIKAGAASGRSGASPPIIVVQNWFEELQRLVPK